MWQAAEPRVNRFPGLQDAGKNRSTSSKVRRAISRDQDWQSDVAEHSGSSMSLSHDDEKQSDAVDTTARSKKQQLCSNCETVGHKWPTCPVELKCKRCEGPHVATKCPKRVRRTK